MSEDATGTDAGHPLTVTVIPPVPSATSPGGGTAGPTAPDATGTDGGHPLTVTVIPDG
jgi:hypothetical protein